MTDAAPPASATPPSLAPSSLAPSNETARALQANLVAAIARNHGKGGGVLRIESSTSGVVWEGAAGLRSARGESAVAMRAGDTFEVASITKTFTAACALLLVEDGALELDAPIGRALPASTTNGLLVFKGHDYGAELTLRQLLSHRSGMPDYWTDPPFVKRHANAFLRAFLADRDRVWKPDEILPYVRALTPIGPPGSQFHYADSNYVVLGLLLERVTGSPLPQLLRERLLEPLGLHDTYFSYLESPRNAAHSHRYEGALDLDGQPRQTADWAGGGLVSSTRDLSRFLFALAEGKLFRLPTTYRAMTEWTKTTTEGVSYGLGLFHVELPNGAGDLIGHDGHGNAFMYYSPQRRWVWSGTLNQTENDWWTMVVAASKTVEAP